MDIIYENSINEEDKLLIEEYKAKNLLHPDFLPFFTYDLVQTGYPYPNKGEMIIRPYGGSDEQGRLLSGNGEWVKVSTVLELIKRLQNV